MTCLEDYVGIQGCSATTPDSGKYVNDLPGIQLKDIDEIANDEQLNYNGVWTEVQARAIARFRTDFISRYSKKYKLKQVQKTIDFGRKIDAATTTVAAAKYRGFTIELDHEEDQYVNSNLQAIYVQSVAIYLSGSFNFNIKIIDLDTETVLKTLAVTGVSGWNLKNINETYLSKRILIAYDATLVTGVELDISDFKLSNYCNCSGELHGVQTASLADLTTTEGDSTFGLTGIFSIRCTFDNVVCNNKELFARAWQFCLGYELMIERLFSSRVNRWVITDHKKSLELRDYFFKEYESELDLIVDTVNLNLNDSCIDCNEDIRFISSTA